MCVQCTYITGLFLGFFFGLLAVWIRNPFVCSVSLLFPLCLPWLFLLNVYTSTCSAIDNLTWVFIDSIYFCAWLAFVEFPQAVWLRDDVIKDNMLPTFPWLRLGKQIGYWIQCRTGSFLNETQHLVVVEKKKEKLIKCQFFLVGSEGVELKLVSKWVIQRWIFNFKRTNYV